jgi:hypothetical protein
MFKKACLNKSQCNFSCVAEVWPLCLPSSPWSGPTAPLMSTPKKVKKLNKSSLILQHFYYKTNHLLIFVNEILYIKFRSLGLHLLSAGPDSSHAHLWNRNYGQVCFSLLLSRVGTLKSTVLASPPVAWVDFFHAHLFKRAKSVFLV